METIKDKLPVIIRYAVTIIAGYLASRGLIPEDALPPIVQDQIVAAIIAVVGVVPLIWALIKRPSAKAMEVARVVDADFPKKDDIILKTPAANEPDIIVKASPK